MNRYYHLIAQKKSVKHEIKQEEKRMHNALMVHHKTRLRWLDVSIALAILFNMGALAMSNLMIVEAKPQMKIVELNPVVGKAQNYETLPVEKAKPLLKQFYKPLLFYAFVVFFVIFMRMSMFTESILNAYTILVFYALAIFGYDFFNDLGYFLGKVMFA